MRITDFRTFRRSILHCGQLIRFVNSPVPDQLNQPELPVGVLMSVMTLPNIGTMTEKDRDEAWENPCI